MLGFFRSQEEYRYNFQVGLANSGAFEANVVRQQPADSIQVLFTSLLSGEPEVDEKGTYHLPRHHLVIQVHSARHGSVMNQKIELPNRAGKLLELQLDSMQLKLECSKDFEVFEVSERAAGRDLRFNRGF